MEKGKATLPQTDLEAVVGPGAKLELALLLVKGEVERVEGAGAVQHGLRHPQNLASVLHHHQRLPSLLQPVVGTETTPTTHVSRLPDTGASTPGLWRPTDLKVRKPTAEVFVCLFVFLRETDSSASIRIMFNMVINLFHVWI